MDFWMHKLSVKFSASYAKVSPISMTGGAEVAKFDGPNMLIYPLLAKSKTLAIKPKP
ncbi:MAG: hypothetical protein ACFNTA_02760 [Campylobacter sp.]|uniref:hypothetical protein n=1 Tax=Campylobacter sp. TaxID=205 RepID=UPI00360A5C71